MVISSDCRLQHWSLLYPYKTQRLASQARPLPAFQCCTVHAMPYACIYNDKRLYVYLGLQNETNADSLEQPLGEFSEMQQRYLSSIKRLSKLENELVEMKKLNQSLMEQVKDYEAKVTGEVGKDCSTKNFDLCQLRTELDKLREQHDNKNLPFEQTDKDEKIKSLKERCDDSYQQIKTLEQEKADLGGQAKQFESVYHLQVEENQSLRFEIKKLKHQLNAQTSVIDSDLDDKEGRTIDYKKVLSSLRSQVKSLKDDIAKLRDHSEDQSHQLLKYIDSKLQYLR